MDNIIEIVVFFFIIYSILSSFLGKKKKSPYKVPDNQTGDVKQKTSPNRESIETLEELFGFKFPKTEDEFPTAQTKSKPERIENISWDPEKDFQQKISKRESFSNRNIEKTVPDINYDKTPSYTSASKRKISKTDVKQTKAKIVENKKVIEIRKKLAEQNSIKEAIILSEILNKPKALRR